MKSKFVKNMLNEIPEEIKLTSNNIAMDLALRQAIINIGHSYRFLKMAIAYRSPFLKDYEKSHLYYLEAYKKLKGEDFIYPEGVMKLI